MEKESVYSDTDQYTGYKYLTYTLIKNTWKGSESIMSHEKASVFVQEVKRDGEISRLKAKCRHASEVLEKIDKSIRDWDLNLDENKDDLRDWIDAVREYLSKE
ncbi:hypothetical protein [Clostridium beijerinckii]|uniref:hypothetical protein n=2 Tax=Clostridium beijerinckii TaxID=1520 RepID=UPI001F4BDD96|nr:hypothetical protein [Clostridium beijerinckii]